MPLPIEVWLIHPSSDMCDAFRSRFAGLPNVTVLQSRFEELPPHDCFVTAANSYGIMTAGIDAAIVRFHGEELMKDVQYHILDRYLGEQPIGTAFVHPTQNADYPFRTRLMAMDAEHDALYADVERLLNTESGTDDVDLKRNLVDTAISKAAALVQRSPNNVDFHHLHGLAWYHHPDKSDARLTNIRSALERALSIEPQHHFANQYLGYINFDVGDFATAKPHFDATDHAFFESIDQKWRSLKAIELAFVCQLRLDQPVDADALNQFFDSYWAEERETIPNTVVPLELRRCAEWLFDQNGHANAEPLHSIVNFLHACGDLARSAHSRLKASR